MDLIDTYVKNVGLHLPEKSREDIEKEIRSAIEDALEDESQAKGKAPDEEMIVEILKRMGPPEKVAASYQPPRYLIGPKLFPHYMTVLRIVLPIIVVLGALGAGVRLGSTVQVPADFTSAFAQELGEIFNSVLYVVGMITVIFAIIERVNPGISFEDKVWDPRKMRLESDPDERVKPVGPILQIIVNILAILVVNLYPEWIGFTTIQNGQWMHAPILSEAFFQQFLPWITLYWALEAGESALLLAQGRRTTLIRWVSVGVRVFAIVLAALLLVGPSIISIDAAAIAKMGWGNLDAAMLRIIDVSVTNSFRLAIGIILIISVIELIKDLYKLLLQKRIQTVFQ